MTTYRWRPVPNWTVYLPGDKKVSLTPYALQWNVMFGSRYEPSQGRFRLLTARGRIVLNNASGRFDPDHNDPIFTVADLSFPRAIELSLGDETLWQGIALLRGNKPLHAGTDFQVELRGRHFQALQRAAEWRQNDNTAPKSTPFAVMGDMLKDIVGFRDLSPATTNPDKLFWKNVVVDGTLAANWNLLAWAANSVSFEDHTGRLGISAAISLSEGRITDVPASQHAIVPSTLDSMGPAAQWEIVMSDTPTATEPTADITLDIPVVPGANRLGQFRYEYPSGVVGVEWGDLVTRDPNLNVNSFRVVPAADRTLADVILFDTTTTGPVRAGLRITGKSVKASTSGRTIAVVKPANARFGVAAERLEPPPFVNWQDMGELGRTTTDSAEHMAQLVNEVKAHAKLTIPLWAQDEESRPPTNLSGRSGQLVPGSVSRYPTLADEKVDLLTLNVNLKGQQGDIPLAEIEGITYSGAASEGMPLETGITLPDPDTFYPLPFELPLPPPRFTPTQEVLRLELYQTRPTIFYGPNRWGPFNYSGPDYAFINGELLVQIYIAAPFPPPQKLLANKWGLIQRRASGSEHEVSEQISAAIEGNSLRLRTPATNEGIAFRLDALGDTLDVIGPAGWVDDWMDTVDAVEMYSNRARNDPHYFDKPVGSTLTADPDGVPWPQGTLVLSGRQNIARQETILEMSRINSSGQAVRVDVQAQSAIALTALTFERLVPVDSHATRTFNVFPGARLAAFTGWNPSRNRQTEPGIILYGPKGWYGEWAGQ